MGRRDKCIEDLRRCARRGGGNVVFFGQRGLARLSPGVDARLVEHAMRVVFPHTMHRTCARLPAAYEALAWRVIDDVDTPEATFFRARGRLREAAAWYAETERVEAGARHRGRLVALCGDAEALEAARVAVVRHGLRAERLLPVLAFDGSDESTDALIDVAHAALESRGQTLDALGERLLPFARGPRMEALATTVRRALDARGDASPLRGFFARFGATGRKPRLEVHAPAAPRSPWCRLVVVLDAGRAPSVEVRVFRQRVARLGEVTRWEDGALVEDALGLGAPADLDALPAWLAQAARRLRVRWLAEGAVVTSSLRGRGRQEALAWLWGAGAGR